MKNLVIVESPHKAETFSKFLGKDYKVMSSVGHIRDLRKKGMSVDIDGDFSPIYEIPADKKEVVKKLKAAAKEADTVWLASDEDREGEAIAWHLAEVLGLDPATTKRIVFHEITEPAMRYALAHPRHIDLNLVNAQQARRVLDRIVGFELSPVLWKKIKPSLSAGRVQSVDVRLVCEREQEIRDFVPVPFYRADAVFSAAGGAFKARAPKRFDSEADARQFLDRCADAEKSGTPKFTVADISVSPVTRKPQPPFTTPALQKEANRRLGFSVNTIMRIAQKLYEEGLITYMRTDSTNLSEIALKDIASVVEKDFGKDYVKTRRYHVVSKGAQEAHEAIRPTYMDRATINGTPQEQKLYTLIRNHTIASQMADARLEKTNVDIALGGETIFKATGETMKFDGFLKAFGQQKNSFDKTASDSGDNTLLPPLSKGMELDPEEITVTQSFTQPPARYTEGTLIDKMKELGIGRPATYATFVSTIQERGYVVHGDKEGTPRDYDVFTLRDGEISKKVLTENTGSTRGKLVPTDTGLVVNEFLTQYFPDILDYNFTASMEEKFDDIARGELPWQKEMADFYKNFHPEIEKVDSMRMEHKVGERILGNDPKSGKRVSAKIGRFGPVVQIGEATDEEKPQFASIPENLSMSEISLEEALKLFELPRTLGTLDGETVKASEGRFGPYVQIGRMFVSIPADKDPRTITLAEAGELIAAKKEAEAKKEIKVFPEEPAIKVLNGRFGPYIAYMKEGARKAVNYKIPKGTDPASLSLEEIRKLMEAQDAAPKRRKSR